MHNPYEIIPAAVQAIIQESPTIRTLRIRPDRPIAFRTGQFIELSIPGVGEGPFTPSSSHFVSEIMDVTIMKAGYVTKHIHRTQVGDRVGLREIGRAHV